MTTAYLMSKKPLNFDMVPSKLAESYPIEETLKILGFDEKSPFGNPMRSWGPLEVSAGPWFGCWQLMFSTKWRSELSIPVPYELRIRDYESPIVILSIIHDAWHSWFSDRETPCDLQLGKDFGDRNWEAILKEYANRPTLRVEREFFRFCINYLDKQFDWPEEDCKVEFSYADGQLKVRIKNLEVHCPARGKFNGKLTFSARQLFRYLAKRFVGDTVLIQVTDTDKVIIGSHQLPRQLQAIWVENANAAI